MHVKIFKVRQVKYDGYHPRYYFLIEIIWVMPILETSRKQSTTKAPAAVYTHPSSGNEVVFRVDWAHGIDATAT